MAKKLESTFMNMVLVMFLFTAIAALALGAVYTATKEPIETAKAAKLQEAIAKVVPAYDQYTKKQVTPAQGNDPLTFYIATKGDEVMGTAIETYTDIGFSGRVSVMVGFLPSGEIYNTAVLDHKETPGLGDKMDLSKSDFSLQFKGKNPNAYILKVKKDGGNVDAITAATISSRAFCDAIQRAWTAFETEGGNQ
ncbi:MAG: RnfABCDGE type electron transport complex subunit G [Bacteroidales bacterium]|nr:RnfABCDGE type electron transport complex subunit G [Bacteroidales bacterium]MDD2322097.1 RnfABCDGE type electron transport complex subunit G [Bacteroidales bacterium]MDD3010525.1 RnfABCDGE type electron transport complex subunit G [Bacteroidales bacterium]MDD3961627.1 RnfABCDGE type electron transport complex subunit G [Bacteroidales bacterium]MDY0285466.1 RnfABCDGE type electron transport complex subunit G [Bacteroidales bacterium]